jgi:mannosyl-oligosaccharide glucosidase
MAVTAFIARVKKAAASSGPSDQDLGMDFGMGGAQERLSEPVQHGAGSKYVESPELALTFLKSIYAPLKRHYDWFRRTQRGQIKQYSRVARSRTEGYRWRGRSEQHVLTSGMDDYPRGPPHAGELHLDLISWMAFFTGTMKEIAEFVGELDDATSFGEIEVAILNNIEGTSTRRLAVYTDVCLQTSTGMRSTRCTAMRTLTTRVTHIVLVPCPF